MTPAEIKTLEMLDTAYEWMQDHCDLEPLTSYVITLKHGLASDIGHRLMDEHLNGPDKVKWVNGEGGNSG